jgi:Mn2+/Fe2+ NRAMP family transporter
MGLLTIAFGVVLVLAAISAHFISLASYKRLMAAKYKWALELRVAIFIASFFLIVAAVLTLFVYNIEITR